MRRFAKVILDRINVRIATFAVAVCALSALMGANRPGSNAFVVVRSGNEAPYRAAAERIVADLKGGGAQVREVDLGEWAKCDKKGLAGVVAIGTEAAVRAKAETPEGASVTFCLVADPHGSGLLEGRPARGVRMEPTKDKQLSLLRRALPKARRIGVLYSSESSSSVELLEEARSVASGVTLDVVDVKAHVNPSAAIEALLAKSPDAVWTWADPAVYDAAVVRALLLASLRKTVPVFGYSAAVVRAGALVGVAVSPQEQGAAAALIALNPATDSRMMAPSRWEIALNLEVASRLGVSVPQDVVRDAKVVFEKP